MPTTKTAAKTVEIEVLEIGQQEAVFDIIGTTPLIMERMAEKARREMLLPHGRKNATERATTLKHDPLPEFRASAYLRRSDDMPTRLLMPSGSVKGAIGSAALRLAGVSKTEIEQLTWVTPVNLPIWGIPEVLMSVTRSADMNKTPDIRTRPIIWPWATRITVGFIEPNLTTQTVMRLVAAAGMMMGIGGWRQEKGSGNYGLFRIVTPNERPEFDRLVAEAGREVQDEAMANPACHDEETSELLSWFEDELAGRRQRGVAPLAPAATAAD